MVGVGGAKPTWRLVLLITGLAAQMVAGDYELDKCYCYSDGFDDTLRAQIDAFTNAPSTQAYEYIGVIPKAGDTYDPCVCSDVTRVLAILKVTESGVVTDAADASQRTQLGETVATKLNDLVPTMKSSTAALEHTLISFSAEYESHTSTEVLFTIEALLRGYNEALKDPVSQSLRSALSSNTLAGVGAVDTSSMAFTAVQCITNPPAALLNGQRNWTDSNLASTVAIYTCDDRYSLSSSNSEEVSTCSHNTLTWTALPNGLQCTANVSECDSEPPAAPQHSLSSWDNFTKDEATVVTYTCLDGYSSENNVRAVSTCRSGIWSTIASSFQCIHTGCLNPPPQVPNQGVLVWSRLKADGTTALYSCNSGYKSNTGSNPEIRCTNKTWEGYPDDWACVDEKTKLNLGSDSENGDDDDDGDDINYFYVVTLPSVGGLVLLIICCLCCTRIDSPLFNICNAKGKMDGYTLA